MKRPLLAVGVSYAIATWASFFLGSPLICSAICAVLGLLIFLFRKDARAVPVVLMTAALAFAAHQAYNAGAIIPLRNAQGLETSIQGIVTETEYRPPSFTLTVRCSFVEEALPGTTLRVWGTGDLEFEPGDGISALVRLDELRGSQSYHNSRGVFMGARLLRAEPYSRLSLPDRISGFFLRRSAQASANIAYNLPSGHAGLVAGIALGDISGMDAALSGDLNRSGTAHLVVVSGMHLSILVGCLADLLELLGAGKRLRALVGALAALALASLVGFSPSITRGLVMMLVMLAAQASSRRSDTLNSLGFALLLICVFAPHWTLSRGLWLSAASTAGISICSKPLMRRIRRRYGEEARPVRILADTFLGAGAITISAFVFSLPIVVVTSGWVSLTGPLANILIAPLVMPALVCGMICAFFTAGWAAPFARVASLCAGLIADISRLAASVPFAVFALDEFWMLLWLLLAGGFAVYLIRLKAGRELWRYGITLLALAFAAGSLTSGISGSGRVEVASIDGCSPVVLLREGGAVVIGTPTVYEAGRLTRYLDYRGVKRLDAVIAYDCPEQISSALIGLVTRYDAVLVIGPDDGYILGEMSRALPDAEVVSGGYARIDILGGVAVRTSLDSKEAEIRVGRVSLVKTGEEYAILEDTSPNQVRIWRDGVMEWTRNAPPTFEPLGALVFGERRLVLDV